MRWVGLRDLTTRATTAARGMRRRGATTLVGVILVAGLTALVGEVKVPYVELVPGPTFDTLGDGIISIDGAPTSGSAGQLRFVTVGVIDDLTVVQALVAWFDRDAAVVPSEIIYGQQTPQQYNQSTRQDYVQSESAATAAALNQLGLTEVAVTDVTPGSPADGALEPGDVIRTVDGTTIKHYSDMQPLVSGQPAGTSHTIEVDRGGAPVVVTLASFDDGGTARLGVTVTERPDQGITVKVPNDADVGGPSAGLMLALGIIDKLDPDDLTGGKIIAGTGTIDAAGTVGEIGGVAQKVRGAHAAGAQFFLTPAGNCADAVANAVPGLTLVKVATLTDALNALAQIRAGATPAVCSR